MFLPSFLFPVEAKAHTNKVAIVIDDFGSIMKGTDKMLSLPIPLTVAVMPFLPFHKEDAIATHRKDTKLLYICQMEPIKVKEWLGPKAITTDLSDEEINNRLEQAIQKLPHTIGMNNHMGSKVTADERIVRLILAACKKHGLFYLDSKNKS